MKERDVAAVFQGLYEGLGQDPGVVLFTALRWLPNASVLRRVFTSHPLEYPVGAEKSVEISAGWLETVIARQEPFLAADAEALGDVFTDVALIQALGCGAVINVPVIYDGQVVGVLALLDAEGRYDARSVDAAAATIGAASSELSAAFIQSDRTVIKGKGTVSA